MKQIRKSIEEADGKGDFVYVIKSKFTGKEAGIFEDKNEAEKTLMYLNRRVDAFFITERSYD